MYRLNVQVTAYVRQTVPDRGVVRSCDPLQNFGSSNHITGTAEPNVVKCCTRVGYINSSNRMTYHQQKVWLWSRDCFKILPFVVMQRVARVCLSATAELLVFCTLAVTATSAEYSFSKLKLIKSTYTQPRPRNDCMDCHWLHWTSSYVLPNNRISMTLLTNMKVNVLLVYA